MLLFYSFMCVQIVNNTKRFPFKTQYHLARKALFVLHSHEVFALWKGWWQSEGVKSRKHLNYFPLNLDKCHGCFTMFNAVFVNVACTNTCRWTIN